MTIGGWLSDATKQLVQAGVGSARLDAEIILAHTLGRGRTSLHAHPSEDIEPRLEEIANARLDLRLERVPLAYIIGHKEFYGHRFVVTPQVLVPRPESEEIITLLRQALGDTAPLAGMPTRRLVDIGTGSGVLGITAKLLYPELDVTLCDTSGPALAVAEKNANALQAQVRTLKSDLLQDYPFSPDIVLANLPYVDNDWQHISPELRHEPPEALYAPEHGLRLIRECFGQLAHRMKPDGLAIFEADPRQWSDIEKIAEKAGFRVVEKGTFAYVFVKR